MVIDEVGDGVDDAARAVFLDARDDDGMAPGFDEAAHGEDGGVARLAGDRRLWRRQFWGRRGRVLRWLRARRAAVFGFGQQVYVVGGGQEGSDDANYHGHIKQEELQA